MADKDLIPVPCKALGEKRGRYYVTEKMRGTAAHLIALVESRRLMERNPESRREHTTHIEMLRKESNPVWTELLEEFNAHNTHLSDTPRTVAYRHFMESLRRELGYPDLVNGR